MLGGGGRYYICKNMLIYVIKFNYFQVLFKYWLMLPLLIPNICYNWHDIVQDQGLLVIKNSSREGENNYYYAGLIGWATLHCAGNP